MSKLELDRSCLKVAMRAESFQKRIPSGSVFFGEKLTTEIHILRRRSYSNNTLQGRNRTAHTVIEKKNMWVVKPPQLTSGILHVLFTFFLAWADHNFCQAEFCRITKLLFGVGDVGCMVGMKKAHLSWKWRSSLFPQNPSYSWKALDSNFFTSLVQQLLKDFFPTFFPEKLQKVPAPSSATENNAEMLVFGRQVSGVFSKNWRVTSDPSFWMETTHLNLTMPFFRTS